MDKRDALPMQMGLVKFGGMFEVALLDAESLLVELLYMMPMAKLKPSTRDRS